MLDIYDLCQSLQTINISGSKKVNVENPGIDPGTSRMLSERSTM